MITFLPNTSPQYFFNLVDSEKCGSSLSTPAISVKAQIILAEWQTHRCEPSSRLHSNFGKSNNPRGSIRLGAQRRGDIRDD